MDTLLSCLAYAVLSPALRRSRLRDVWRQAGDVEVQASGHLRGYSIVNLFTTSVRRDWSCVTYCMAIVAEEPANYE